MTLGVPTPSLPFSQNFDGVTAPRCLTAGPPPADRSGPSPLTGGHAPNSVFVADPSTITDNLLVSPSVYSSSANAQLTFRHYYITESGYDGCVLEISINGGGFADILTAGGSFASGAYNGTIYSSYGNPLAGRPAWTGNSAAASLLW